MKNYKLHIVLILTLFIVGCSSSKKLSEQSTYDSNAVNTLENTHVNYKDSVSYINELLSISDSFLLDKVIKVIQYDTDKQKDSLGNYPIKVTIEIIDKSKLYKTENKTKNNNIKVIKKDSIYTIKKDSINTKITTKKMEEKSTVSHVCTIISLLLIITVLAFLFKSKLSNLIGYVLSFLSKLFI